MITISIIAPSVGVGRGWVAGGSREMTRFKNPIQKPSKDLKTKQARFKTPIQKPIVTGLKKQLDSKTEATLNRINPQPKQPPNRPNPKPNQT